MCSRVYPRPACMCTEFFVSVVWTQTHTHTYNCILGERSLPGAAVWAFSHFYKEAQPTAERTDEPHASLPKTGASKDPHYENRAWCAAVHLTVGPGALHLALLAPYTSFFVLGLPQPLYLYPHHPLLGANDMSSQLRNAGAVSLAVRSISDGQAPGCLLPVGVSLAGLRRQACKAPFFMLPDSKSLGPSLPVQISVDTEITHLLMQGRPVGRLALPSPLRSQLLIPGRREHWCPRTGVADLRRTTSPFLSMPNLQAGPQPPGVYPEDTTWGFRVPCRAGLPRRCQHLPGVLPSHAGWKKRGRFLLGQVPSARSLVDVSPGWWPRVQASDLEATRLPTAGPGHHLPEAASLEGQPGPQDGPGPLLHSPPSLDGKQLQPSHGATCPQRGFGGHSAESEAFLIPCFQSFPESRKFLEWRAATRPFAAGISKLQGLFCS